MNIKQLTIILILSASIIKSEAYNDDKLGLKDIKFSKQIQHGRKLFRVSKPIQLVTNTLVDIGNVNWASKIVLKKGLVHTLLKFAIKDEKKRKRIENGVYVIVGTSAGVNIYEMAKDIQDTNTEINPLEFGRDALRNIGGINWLVHPVGINLVKLISKLFPMSTVVEKAVYGIVGGLSTQKFVGYFGKKDEMDL